MYTESFGKAYDSYWSPPFGQHGIVQLVWIERVRQIEKFGIQQLPSGTNAKRWGFAAEVAKKITDIASTLGGLTWADVLGEEFAEALAEEDPDKLAVELIQVMAVCVAWLQDLDRQKAEEETV